MAISYCSGYGWYGRYGCLATHVWVIRFVPLRVRAITRPGSELVAAAGAYSQSRCATGRSHRATPSLTNYFQYCTSYMFITTQWLGTFFVASYRQLWNKNKQISLLLRKQFERLIYARVIQGATVQRIESCLYRRVGEKHSTALSSLSFELLRYTASCFPSRGNYVCGPPPAFTQSMCNWYRAYGCERVAIWPPLNVSLRLRTGRRLTRPSLAITLSKSNSACKMTTLLGSRGYSVHRVCFRNKR